MYVKLHGKNPETDKKSMEYVEKACTLNDAGICYMLGIQYAGNKNTEQKQKDKALKFFEKSCKLYQKNPPKNKKQADVACRVYKDFKNGAKDGSFYDKWQ